MKRSFVALVVGIAGLFGVWWVTARETSDFFDWLQSQLTRLTLLIGATVGNYMDVAANLVAGFEGFSSTAYPDPPGQNSKYSIGYGHQLVAGDGLSTDSTVSESQAHDLLVNDLATADECISANVTVDLSDNQRVALISLCYNIGCGAFSKSTLVAKLNGGDYEGAAEQFGAWIYASGAVNDALVSRRSSEQGVFES